MSAVCVCVCVCVVRVCGGACERNLCEALGRREGDVHGAQVLAEQIQQPALHVSHKVRKMSVRARSKTVPLDSPLCLDFLVENERQREVHDATSFLQRPCDKLLCGRQDVEATRGRSASTLL